MQIKVYAVAEKDGRVRAMFRTAGAARSWCRTMNKSAPGNPYQVYLWAMPAKYWEFEDGR